MRIESERDFPELRKQFSLWRKRFPMFSHDIIQIEKIIEKFIQDHSTAGVFLRQTKKKSYLEQQQQAIDNINRVLATVEKLELMAMLSQG